MKKINKKTCIILALFCIILLALFVVYAKFQINKKDFILENNLVKKMAYSELADKGKITSVKIDERKTGTGPFDEVSQTNSQNADGSIKWTAGNDTSESDNIVRSFDQITWKVVNTMALKEGVTDNHIKGGVIEIKASLPEECKNLVEWDLNSMNWVENAKITNDGTVFSAQYTMSESEITIPGEQSLEVILKVLGAPNGLEIKPTFSVNLLGGEEETISVTDNPIIVSAAPNYNINLQQNNDLQKKMTVDYGSGNISGRMYGYAIILQLYNNNPSKGLKGIEYPKGDITFDINLKLERTKFGSKEIEDITNSCIPVLWNYKINNTEEYGNIAERIMFWGNSYHKYGKVPLGKASRNRTESVYNGGNIKMEQKENTIHTTISNYEFDGVFPIYNFVYENARHEGRDYLDNIGCFSTGYFQIFVPDNQESTIQDRNYYLTVSDNNFKAISCSKIATTTQQNTNDDICKINHVIYKSGIYRHCMFLQNNNGRLGSSGSAGDSKISKGKIFKIGAKFNIDLNNDQDVFSAIKFIKFDGDAVEPILFDNGEKYQKDAYNGTMKFNVYYVTKKDGTNWTSQQEMNKANIDDSNLELYKNITDIPSGKICIGEYLESTNNVNGNLAVETGDNNTVLICVKVKDTAVIGRTYGFTQVTKMWVNYVDREQYSAEKNNFDKWPKETWSSGNPNYIKTEYDEQGNIKTGTHSGGWNAGQSLLIVGADLKISKKAIDEKTEETKINYDFSKNEYDVTYKLEPILANESNSKENITGVNLKIEDTLPTYMTYIKESCKYGEPEIRLNQDGTTTLIWYINNVTSGNKIEPILYKAHINELVKTGTTLNSTVTISEVPATDQEGNKIYKVGNSEIKYRTSTNSIQVVNLTSFSFYKTTQTPIIEKNGGIHYKIIAINKADEAINNLQLLDILPYNGDDRGTVFNGTYMVEKIEIMQTDLEKNETVNNNLNIYVTENETARNGVTVKDKNLGTSQIWTKANSGDNINKELTACAVTGVLNKKTKLELDIYIKTNNNKSGDIYNNTATAQTNINSEIMQTPAVPIQTVKRKIEGKCWYDKNKDGEMNGEEIFLSNIEVKLLNEEGGEIATTKTDKDGYYCFENLEKENYKVKVSINNEQEISKKKLEIGNKFNQDGITDVIKSLNNIDYAEITQSNVNAGIVYKDTTYTVKYLEMDNTPENNADNKVLTPEKTVNTKYQETVTEEAVNIEGYTVDSANKTLIITTQNKEIIFYYTKRADLSYTVRYVDKETGIDLKTKKEDNQTFGSVVTEKAIDIEGYNKVNPTEQTITIGVDENKNQIIFEYTKRTDLSYTVRYLEEDETPENSKDNHVLKEETINNQTFNDKISVLKKIIEITGYTCVRTEPEETITISANSEKNIINIYYKKISGLSYVVNYLEKGTNEIVHLPKVVENLTFEDKITEQAINIEGYNKINPTEQTITIGVDENKNQITFYYEKRNDLEYKVNYLEKGTNKIIHESKTVKNQVFNSEIISKNEVIQIDGYTYDSVDKKSLIIKVEKNEINIYYTKRADLSYTINYLEKDTNKVLHEPKTVTNQTFGTTITSSEQVIEIDGYVYDSASKEKLEISTNENILNIYYVRKLSTVTIKYVDINTGEEISEEIVKTGYVYDEYDIPQKDIFKQISQYTLIQTPNTKGIFTNENQIKIVYYAKNAKVIVKYVNEDTNEEISEEIIEGYVGKEYSITPKIKEGYKLVQEESKEGVMTEEPIEITYYCEKIKSGNILNNLPNTGDMTPVILIFWIVTISVINLIPIIRSKKTNKKS